MKKNNEEVKDNEKLSFFEKLKDKKYKAKLELCLGFGFILVLLIYANVTGVGNNYNYDNTVSNDNQHTEDDYEEFSLDKVSNNYNYSVDIVLDKSDELDKDSLENYTYNYSGKVYRDQVLINKKVNDNVVTYYKNGNEYYISSMDKYDLIDEKEIFDLIDYKYVSLEGIKSYIDKSSLDHTTNYSNGNVSYVYNLRVRDIVKSYLEDDIVNIEINVVSDVVSISIDYSNLLKQIDNTISSCKVEVKYDNIGNVLEFGMDS